MRFIFLFLFVVPALASAQNLSLWINTEFQIAHTRMLSNISPAGTAPGVILASPSKSDPNYYYFWVRDGAIVMETLVDLYENGDLGVRGQNFSLIDTYVGFTRSNQLQTVDNLGEPRFNVDGSLNTEPWGRPQNDGPALRALTLIHFANLLLDDGQEGYVRTRLYSASLPAQTVIKADLEFVAHHWQDSCVDLWEEVRGHHFFTEAVQLAALRQGAALAERMNDGGAQTYYIQQAEALETELARHWSESSGYYLATLDFQGSSEHQKPSQLDVSVILGALLANEDSGVLDISDSRIIATVTRLENTFAALYPINSDTRFAPAIGRYPEDTYFGGNPWVLATAAFAEFNFRLAKKITDRPDFYLTADHVLYFSQLLSGTERAMLVPGVRLDSNTRLRSAIISALIRRGDSFMSRLQEHVNPDGSYSEQIDKQTGYMISARDLSWSYAGFIRAVMARNEVEP